MSAFGPPQPGFLARLLGPGVADLEKLTQALLWGPVLGACVPVGAVVALYLAGEFNPDTLMGLAFSPVKIAVDIAIAATIAFIGAGLGILLIGGPAWLLLRTLWAEAGWIYALFGTAGAALMLWAVPIDTNLLGAPMQVDYHFAPLGFTTALATWWFLRD